MLVVPTANGHVGGAGEVICVRTLPHVRGMIDTPSSAADYPLSHSSHLLRFPHTVAFEVLATILSRHTIAGDVDTNPTFMAEMD